MKKTGGKQRGVKQLRMDAISQRTRGVQNTARQVNRKSQFCTREDRNEHNARACRPPVLCESTTGDDSFLSILFQKDRDPLSLER